MKLQQLFDLPIRHRALFLLALGALLYLPALDERELWYPDEPDIGEVTQAMFDSGDWVLPRRMGSVWIDYPPMIYWAGTLSSHLLGGVSELSLRLPIALAAIALVLVTSSFARRWFDERTGLWAGLALLTSLQFVYEAICYRPDMFFGLFITAGFLVYASAFGERVRWGPRIAGFALLGLAILSKGPLGLLLPGLVLTVWHGVRREWRRLFELAPLALVALAVALPWYFACGLAMGWENLVDELLGQNFERFTGSAHGARDRGHIQPFYYYLLGIWVDIFPWSLLLPSAVWWLRRGGRWRDRRVQLALVWLGVFLVFLSLASTKRQIYLLPAYPAAAILLGPWLARVGREPADEPAPAPRHARVAGWTFAGLMALVGIVALVGGIAAEPLIVRFGLEPFEADAVRAMRWPLMALAAISLAAAAWVGTLCYQRRVRGVLRSVTATMVVVLLLVGVEAMPAAEPVKSYAPAGAWLSSRVAADQPVGMVNGSEDHGWRKMGGISYYSGRHVMLLESRRATRRFLRRHPDSPLLVYEGLAEETFAPDESWWRRRVVHELRAGRYHYLVLQGSAAE